MSVSCETSSESNIMPGMEYSALVDEIEQMISSNSTISYLGGQRNYDKLIDMMDIYHHNEETISKAACELVADVNMQSFDYMYCFNSGFLLWKFLKTTETFKKAPWYYRDYVIAKILRPRVKVDEIFYNRSSACQSGTDNYLPASSMQIMMKNSRVTIRNIDIGDRQAVWSYFAERGHKGTLNNMMYNFYTRRVTSYKLFLYKLFPKDSCATEDRKNYINISRKRSVSNKALRRAVKAKNYRIQPSNIDKEDTEILQAIDNTETEDIINEDISTWNGDTRAIMHSPLSNDSENSIGRDSKWTDFVQAEDIFIERFHTDKDDIHVNLKRREIQEILHLREPHVQEDIVRFLDDVQKLNEATAA